MKDNTGVSIITITNNDFFIENIFENYNRQDYTKKELIVVLNNNKLRKSQYEKKANKFKNIRIFKIDEKKTLGSCLNYAIKLSKHEILAKFDDDDYYGSKYLSESLKAFNYNNVDIIGKSSHMVYFENSRILALRNPNHENKFVSFVNGSTLIFNKNVFKKVKFADMSIAEDVKFCNDCRKKGFKIYSTDRFHHVYIRRTSKKYHTWKIKDKIFLKNSCEIIDYTKNFKIYADKEINRK